MRLSIGSQCTDMNVVASLRDAKFCIRCSFARSVVLIPGRTALTYSSIDVTWAYTKVEKQMDLLLHIQFCQTKHLGFLKIVLHWQQCHRISDGKMVNYGLYVSMKMQ